MPEFPPFITDKDDNLVVANATDEKRGFHIKKGDSVYLSCPKENFANYPSESKLEIRFDCNN